MEEEGNKSSHGPEKKKQKLFNQGETTMGATDKLCRFLHTGDCRNVVICQRSQSISIEDLDERLNFIKDLAALDCYLPEHIIRRAVLSDTLRRNDEALLAIAFCLRRVNNIEAKDVRKMRTEIYKNLPKLLKTDSDLFLFVDLSNKLLVDVDSTRKTGFGRGMKKALRQWYENRTTIELVNIFGRNRGMYGWTHRDIIHMSHMNFGQTDKAKIINTLFKRGSTISEQLQITAQTPLETKPEPIQRMFQICSLKVNESAADAAKLIRVHDFEMGHLPVHLISQPAVWDILLPKMNYRETLKVLLTLYSLNILNVGDPLSTRMCMSLVNNSSLKDSHIHPLEIYSILKLYEKNQRYNESVKNELFQKKKVKKYKLVPNPDIVKRLTVAVTNSMSTCPQTGCEFCITLDLRKSNQRHPVLRMNQINCFEAMVLFALTMQKREKNTKIFTFSENESILLPVNFTDGMSLEDALSHCETLLMEKTKPNLSLPFKYVDKKSKNTIFITIVDSVSRFDRTGEAPIDEFRLHRKVNTHSKYIVLNLRRNHADLQFNYEKGFLEICGLTPDIWRLINAFAMNSFP